MVDKTVLHQGNPLILEAVRQNLYPGLGQCHWIVIDEKEVRVVDVDYLMHVCIVGKKCNSALFILGAHSDCRVEGVAKSIPGPSEFFDPKLWIQQ